MIEDWIDILCGVWAGVSDQRFGNVKSFNLISEKDFPAAINAAELDIRPIAITIADNFDPQYSVGGPRLGFYSGVTQFHVCSDLSMARMPELHVWPGKILRAAAAAMKLNGKVEYFLIKDTDGIAGPIALQYGAENPHWGFLVQWQVKEVLNGLTVSA